VSAGAPPRVLLFGMMGVGKTTVGRLLAAHLGWRHVDVDDEVVRTAGRSIDELWRHGGEAAFRAAERAALADVLDGDGPAVVSVGGGAPLAEDNRARMRAAGINVWLRARTATLVERIGSGGGRPLLADDPGGAVARLAVEREPSYAGLADVVVDVDGRTPEEVVELVAAAIPQVSRA